MKAVQMLHNSVPLVMWRLSAGFAHLHVLAF